MDSHALADDRVELWLAPVVPDYTAAQLRAFETLLDGEERARWQRFRFAQDRQRFLVGRAFMRTVLAGCLGSNDPAALRFDRREHGKPELAGAHAGRLHFNLSHTHALLVLAVSRRYAVGVDVEAVTRAVDLLPLAQRYFSAGEYSALAALEPAARREHFFRLWTLKEAWLKARGLGLREPLDAFSFDFAGADPVLVPGPQLDAEPRDWHLRFFTHDVFRIALAIQCAVNTPMRVQVLDWRA